MGIIPFHDGDTFATFRNLMERTTEEIKALENDYVLKASPTELEQYFLDKVTIQSLTLHTDQYHVENQSGTEVDVTHDFNRMVFPGERAVVRGTCLDIAIPFEGNAWLWQVRPSTYSLSGYPEIEIRENSIVFSCVFPDDSADPQRLKAQIDQNVRSLSDAVDNLRRDVENHNNSAPAIINAALERKRSRASATTSAITNLGIPIRRRNEPLTFTVPTRRRPSPAPKPAVAAAPYEPEPVLAAAEYEHILSVTRSMSLVIERNPSSFVSLDEEAIRTQFLLHLNGHYEGCATGETFNASGKTDILIRVGDRNIFIAECKFWRGPKSFSDAIDQLLGYLSWRDSKCALIIFNKTQDTTAVYQKMHEIMEARLEHKQTVSHGSSGDSRYIFVKKTDPGREITITTQLFDVPIEAHSES